MHLQHARICISVNGSTVNVVAKVRLTHDEDWYISHGAEVDKVMQFALNETLVDDGVVEPLGKACKV